MTRAVMSATLSISNNSSAPPRYQPTLANQKTNATTTCSNKNAPAQSAAKTRLPSTLNGLPRCQPVAKALTSSGRAKATDKGVSLLTSSTQKNSNTDARLFRSTDIGSECNRTDASARSKPTSDLANTVSSKTSELRFVDPNEGHPRSVLPKLVMRHSDQPDLKKAMSSAHCDKRSSVIPPMASKSHQLKQPTKIGLSMLTASTASSASVSSSKNRKHKVLLPCGRPANSTGSVTTKLQICRNEQSNSLVRAVRAQQQNNERTEGLTTIRTNSNTSANSGSFEAKSKQALDYGARIAGTRPPPAIKLKTIQRRSKEDEQTEKSEAANLSHVGSNGIAAGEQEAETVNSGSCLANNLRDRQDEEVRPREKGQDGLVSIREFACASGKRKHDSATKEGLLGVVEISKSRQATSGRMVKSETGEIREDSFSSLASRLQPSLLTSSKGAPTEVSSAGRPRETPKSRDSSASQRNDESGQIAASSRDVSSLEGCDGLNDIKQHEKQRQHRKGSLSSGPPSPALLKASRPRMLKLQQKQRDDLTNSNKCRNKLDAAGNSVQSTPRSQANGSSKHEMAHDKQSQKTKGTKASSSSCAMKNSDLDAHSINSSHVLLKPMGHRVLSLMMLDAGLFPADKDHATNETKTSHVCLKSKPQPLQPNRLIEFPTNTNGQDDINNNIVGNEVFEPTKCFLGKSECVVATKDLRRSSPCCDKSVANSRYLEVPLKVKLAVSREFPDAEYLFNLEPEAVKSTSISLPSSPRLSHHNSLIARRDKKPCQTIFQTAFTEKTIAADTQGISRSVTSSCSSLLSNYPPMLSLSNTLDGIDFSEMIKVNKTCTTVRKVDQDGPHPSWSSDKVPILDSISDSRKNIELPLSDRFEINPLEQSQVEQSRAHAARTILVNESSTGNPSSKIDCFVELQRSSEKEGLLLKNSITGSKLEYHAEIGTRANPCLESTVIVEPEKLNCQVRDKTLLNQAELHVLQSRPSANRIMDHHTNHRQPRSYSISGQEFHHLGPEYNVQRSKQSHFNATDSNQYYTQKMRERSSSNQYNQCITDRPISPTSALAGGLTDLYIPRRSSSIKYPYDKQPTARNHIHASLECLNTIYMDHNQPNQKQSTSNSNKSRHYVQQFNQSQQQAFKQRPSFQNSHYATTYVMTAAPVDTVVNRNAEQDLAAAAMSVPHHYNPMLSTNLGSNTTRASNGSTQSNGYLPQGAFSNRSNTPIAQNSPLHRRLVHGPMASILNQITSSSSNPLRAGHSSLSLASSTYLIEDKLQNEIKQLQSELKTEKEKNEALNSQLSINSNLMAAFEQSLTTLNNRLRQMTALNERKDEQISHLKNQLDAPTHLLVEPSCETSEKSTSPIFTPNRDSSHRQEMNNVQNGVSCSIAHQDGNTKQTSPLNNDDQQKDLSKVIEDLKRQLIEKDRLLTDTRLEALSAAHQLEQLESRINGEHNLMVNEDDLDEGVMVVNHSPSDSEAITDSAHFSEQNTMNSSSHYERSNQDLNITNQQAVHHRSQRSSNNLEDMILFTPTQVRNTSGESYSGGLSNNSMHSNDDTNEVAHLHRRQQDSHSDHSSSDYNEDDKSPGDASQLEYEANKRTDDKMFNSSDKEVMNNLMNKLSLSN